MGQITGRARLIPAVYFMQSADLEILTAAAQGAVDLNLVARVELAARGLDQTGAWVGFEAAGKALVGSSRAVADRLNKEFEEADRGPCGADPAGDGERAAARENAERGAK